jgi:DNA primase
MLKADNYYYTKDITKEVIDNYYSGVKKYIKPHTKDISGEEIFISSPKSVTYFVLDIDPGKDVIWGDIKRGVLQLHDFLEDTEKLKEIKIYFTGENSFHLWCYLKSKKLLKDVKKEWRKILDEKFKDSDFLVLDKKNPKNNQINIEFKSKYIAPYSLRKETGLACVDIPVKKLKSFKKLDATLDKVYKKIVGEKFPWKSKKAYHSDMVFRVAMSSLTQPLVSTPPYRGNLLEYLQQKQDEEDKEK